jgi:hypothetical protein
MQTQYMTTKPQHTEDENKHSHERMGIMKPQENRPLIAPNSHKNTTQFSQQDMSCPGKKAPWTFLSFFPSQQAEDRASIRTELCNILDP